MGTTWNTYRQTKEQFVHQMVMSYKGPNLVLAHSVRGNNLWLLIKPGDNEPIIGLAILYCQDGCWGYRDMAEADSPYRYDCPLSYLDRAPEPNGFNKNHQDSGKTWRDFVRKYHESQRTRTKLKIGDKIKLTDKYFYPGYIGEYTVTHSLGRRGFMLNGCLRLKCHQVKYVTKVA